MTLTTPSATLWSAFREDPSGDHYLPDSHIVFLPSGAGAAGEQYIRQFFQTGSFSHPKRLDVEEKVIHRTVGESSAVDEVEVTVKFVSGAGGWLLPGIEPHHLEDLVITFPMVVSGSIVDDRIASVRYLWDAASVLKMVRLIGSRQSWPIVAETQVDALRNPSRFRLNPYGNSTVAAGSRPQTGISKIFGATPPVSPSPSTNTIASSSNNSSTPAAKKGHPALTSTVFSHLKNAPSNSDNGHYQSIGQRLPLSPSTSDDSIAAGATSPVPAPVKKGHPALTSTLFNHLKKTDPSQDQQTSYGRERVLSSGNDDTDFQRQAMANPPPPMAKKGHPALTSTLFNHLKEQPQQQPQRKQEEQPIARVSRHEEEVGHAAGWRADAVKPKGHPALTSTIFSHTAAAPAATYTRPYKKTSHNIFGNPDATVKPVASKIVQQQQEEVAAPTVEQEDFSLEPSTLEDSQIEEQLERQEREQELLQKDILSLEALNTAENTTESKVHEHQQEEVVHLEAPSVLNEPEPPMSPPAPSRIQAPVSAGRRGHPNYRSQITIGGSQVHHGH